MSNTNSLKMIHLQLRQTSNLSDVFDPKKAAHAGVWIVSNDRAAWLCWITEHCQAPEQVTIYPLPDNHGALLLGEKPASDGPLWSAAQSTSYSQPPIAHPLRRLADGLWTLLDAVVEPKLTDSDWRQLLREDEICFLHPTLGTLCVDPLGEIKLRELFLVPRVVCGNWDMAVDAPGLPERLLSVSATASLTLEQWVENAGKELGSDHDKLPPLPPSHSERRGKHVSNSLLYARAMVAIPVEVAAHFTGHVLSGLASVAGKLVPGRRIQIPQANTTRTNTTRTSAANDQQWLQRIREWAKRQTSALNEMLEAHRNASIHRLLSMLEKDPSEGLKYAVPLSSEDMHRGWARPGHELTRNRLGWNSTVGSGAADFWDIEARVRAKLLAKYRELAERERALGRFERAAYIYAHLLGDFSTAANMLEQGRMFREAAVVYRDRLKNPSKAADCFRCAGDFREAVHLYHEVEDYIKSGDLLLEIGDTETAIADYRRYVQFCERNRRWADAADCMVQKLKVPDEALSMLRAKWPKGIDNEKCFLKTVSLVEELERAGELARDIDRLLADREVVATQNWPIEALASIYRTNKTPDISAQARSAVFVAASYGLKSLINSRVSHATQWLSTVVPEDPIFSRDTLRYANEKKDDRSKPPSSIPSRGKQLESVAEIKLDEDTKWFHMAKIQSGLVIVGSQYDNFCIQVIEEQPAGRMLKTKFYFLPVPRRATDSVRWIRHCSGVNSSQEQLTLVVSNAKAKAEFAWFDDVDISHPLKLNIVITGERVLDFLIQPLFESAMANRHTNRLRAGGEATIGNFLVRTPDDVELHSMSEVFSSKLEFDTRPYFDSETQTRLHSQTLNVFAEYGSFQPAPPEAVETVWRVAQVLDYISIANGRALRILRNRELLFSHTADSGIVQLIPSPVHSRPRILVITHRGVGVQWMSYDDWLFQSIGPDVYHAQATFTRDGRVVVAHDDGIQVFSNRNREMKLISETSNFSGCQALCLHDSLNMFYTLGQDGLLKLWNVAS